MMSMTKKQLAKMIDELKEFWLARVEFIHDKGLDDEYFEWKQKKRKQKKCCGSR